jgi:hypothetical protein
LVLGIATPMIAGVSLPLALGWAILATVFFNLVLGVIWRHYFPPRLELADADDTDSIEPLT